jgi:hypothetical protein
MKLLRPLLIALLTTLSLAATSHAGTYQVSFPTAGKAGWSADSASGATYCIYQLDCPFANATYPYGVMVSGAVGPRYISFNPPSGTTISAATVTWRSSRTLSYNDRPFTDSLGRPLAFSGGANGTSTFSDINGQFKVGLYASSLSSSWRYGDYIVFSNARFTLDDDSNPTISRASSADIGAAAPWVTSTRQVCVSVSASDLGSGVKTLALYAGGSPDSFAQQTLDSANPLVPGPRSTSSSVCFSSAQLPEGFSDITLGVFDASGNYTEQALGPIAIQRTRPSVSVAAAPSATSVNQVPQYRFAVNPGISGTVSSKLTVTPAGGTPATYDLPVVAGVAAYATADPLPEGAYTWSYQLRTYSGLAATSTGSFTIAIPKPVASIVKAPSGTITDHHPSFEFTADDANFDLQSVELMVNGVRAGAPGGTGINYVYNTPFVLDDDNYVWSFTVVSKSGKSETLTGTFTVVSAPAGSTGGNTGSTGSTGGTGTGGTSFTRVIVAPRAVTVRRGALATVRFTVRRGGVIQKGVAVSCKVGTKIVYRGRTNSRGQALCRVRANRALSVQLRATGARMRAVRVNVRA